MKHIYRERKREENREKKERYRERDKWKCRSLAGPGEEDERRKKRDVSSGPMGNGKQPYTCTAVTPRLAFSIIS